MIITLNHDEGLASLYERKSMVLAVAGAMMSLLIATGGSCESCTGLLHKRRTMFNHTSYNHIHSVLAGGEKIL